MSSLHISQVESYVKETMANSGTSILVVGHDFKHVDRVRNWALRIAKGEGFQNLELLEIAALLHDIGLPCTSAEALRHLHALIGAEMAADFLAKNNLAMDEERDTVVHAIRYHNAAPSAVPGLTAEDREDRVLAWSDVSTLSERSALLRILRDADALDAIGALGLMRAFTSKSFKPEYDPANVRGDTWGLSSDGFDERFAEGLGIGDYIVNQINFQISYYDNLITEAAREIARPLVEFMKSFVLQLEAEIT